MSMVSRLLRKVVEPLFQVTIIRSLLAEAVGATSGGKSRNWILVARKIVQQVRLCFQPTQVPFPTPHKVP